MGRGVLPDAIPMEFAKPQQCGASIIVAASIFTLLCVLASLFAPMHFAGLVTLCIVQAFSLLSHAFGPRTKASQSLSSRFAAAASSTMQNLLGNANAQVAAVGLLAGLLAMFIRLTGLRCPVAIPVVALVFGGLFSMGLKYVALISKSGPQDFGAPPQVLTPSHNSKEFWPELPVDVEEDLCSESILANAVGEPPLLLPFPLEQE